MNILNARGAKEMADKAIDAGVELFIEKTVGPQIRLMAENGNYSLVLELSDFFLEKRHREDALSRRDKLMSKIKSYGFAVSDVDEKSICIDWSKVKD